MASSPLPCIILFSHKDETFNCFSINGSLRYNSKSEGTVLSPIVAKDSYFNNYLVYINKTRSELVFRSLPMLEIMKVKKLDKECSILALTEDNVIGLIGYKDVELKNKVDCCLIFSGSLNNKKHDQDETKDLKPTKASEGTNNSKTTEEGNPHNTKVEHDK